MAMASAARLKVTAVSKNILNAKRLRIGRNGLKSPVKSREYMSSPSNLGSSSTVIHIENSKLEEDPELPPTLCKINISGKEFITTYSCLDAYPDTLLGCAAERQKYYRPELKSYYFNRSRTCLENILTFYQTGVEYFPGEEIPLDMYKKEREFFRLPELSENESESETEDSPHQGGLLSLCPSSMEYQGRKVHLVVMDPRSSRLASIWHFLDIIFIFVSISFMVLETDPTWGKKYFVYDPETLNHHETVYLGGVPINTILFGINALVITFFTLDIIIRFVTWPGFISFFKNIFNILDILSILPFYISVIAHTFHSEGEEEDDHEESTRKKYVILKMCRIFRIVRVFKFVKHSKDLIVIIKVLISSKKELGLLVILLGISTITFGSVMYYIEHESNGTMFPSIMAGCWWSLVTITTLGYGDIYPKTAGGKMLGAMLLTFGMVFLTLPMTIIVSKFGTVYESEKQNLTQKKNRNSSNESLVLKT